jgi:DNA mismatch repair protein MutS2
MPKRILQKALMYFHGVTAPQERSFTSLLEEKDALLKIIEHKKEELHQARQKEQQLKEELGEQKKVTQSWKSQHADLMDEDLMKAQRMISKAIAAVQAKAGPRILDEVNHQLKTEIKTRQQSKSQPESSQMVLPKIGDTVRLKAHPGQVFMVERLSHDDVWLQGDVLKMRVKLHEIEKRSYAAKEPRQTEVKVELAKKDIFDTILDVRGQRVADALETVQNFVDHCAAAGIGPIYIRHGHGTGALKKAIRLWLKQSSYKVQISTGPQALGGDGTTQVDF